MKDFISVITKATKIKAEENQYTEKVGLMPPYLKV